MTLKVAEGYPEDTFTKDKDFAYKDGKIYDILISSRNYPVDIYLGKIRVIIEDGKVIQWMYPLMPVEGFIIINQSAIDRFRSIVETFDNKRNKQERE